MSRKWLVCTMTAALTAVLAACGGQTADRTNDSANSGEAGNGALAADAIAKAVKDPVELTVFFNDGSYTLERFMQSYGNAIQKKYPNFKFRVLVPGKGVTLKDLIAQGQTIDMMQTHRANIYEMLIDLNLQNDISDLVKKYNYNLGTIETVVLDEMRQLADGGIYGLPNGSSRLGLMYNKDVFDKFGVAYPKEGMSWDDTFELAKKLSRVEGGVNYQGLVLIARHYNLMNQLSQGYVDPATNKATLQNDNWKKLFDNFSRAFKIDANPYVPIGQANNVFWKEGRAAMLVSMFVSGAAYVRDTNIRWDMAPLPMLKERPGVGTGLLNYYFNVTSISKHRDQAFLAAAVLASEEFQKAQALNGDAPALKGDKYIDSIGKGVPQFADKNLKSLIPVQPAPSYKVNKYQSIVDKVLDTAFDEVAMGKKDANTALRDADEAANKKIAESNSK
ncbi:MAG: extracellular solute-binding protein family 1 [Paenibacillus sp.]|nr:extracellular solute-binding protein family 1 [Paenibacillus sp.]